MESSTARRLSVPKLYVLADVGVHGPKQTPDAVEAMAQAGVQWVQLRAKQVPDDLHEELLERSRRRLESTSTQLWVNDRPDLALGVEAFGVHLGQEDMAPADARRVLRSDQWIGRSTHNGEQARSAHDDVATDLVAIGPVFRTSNKINPDPTVGLEGVSEVRALTDKPLVAIGGITAENCGRVLAAGADAVAVVGAAGVGRSVESSCREILERLDTSV